MATEANSAAITILNAKVETLLAVQANLTRDLAAVDAREAANEAATTAEVNTFYLLWAGALIFLMQAGFAVLSAGSIRTKNVKNILLKNLLDASLGAIMWWLVGHPIAYDGPNGFFGLVPVAGGTMGVQSRALRDDAAGGGAPFPRPPCRRSPPPRPRRR